ncbi:hypothetical protein GGF32_006127, partial [Allomyces javanicus]
TPISAKPAIVCEPVVLTPGTNTARSLLDTLVIDTHLPLSTRVVIKNMVAVSTQMTDAVRAAGVATKVKASEELWHLDLPIRCAHERSLDAAAVTAASLPTLAPPTVHAPPPPPAPIPLQQAVPVPPPPAVPAPQPTTLVPQHPTVPALPQTVPISLQTVPVPPPHPPPHPPTPLRDRDLDVDFSHHDFDPTTDWDCSDTGTQPGGPSRTNTTIADDVELANHDRSAKPRSGALLGAAPSVRSPSPKWIAVGHRYETMRIYFVAVPASESQSVRQVTAHKMWRGCLAAALQHIGVPINMSADHNKNYIRFCMRRTPNVVEAVVRASGAVVGGVYLEFEPFEPNDKAEAQLSRSPHRAVFVVLKPRKHVFLQEMINQMELDTCQFDCAVVLAAGLNVWYTFVTVAAHEAGRIARLNNRKVRGAKLRVIRIQHPKSVFTTPENVADAVRIIVEQGVMQLQNSGRKPTDTPPQELGGGKTQDTGAEPAQEEEAVATEAQERVEGGVTGAQDVPPAETLEVDQTSPPLHASTAKTDVAGPAMVQDDSVPKAHDVDSVTAQDEVAAKTLSATEQDVVAAEALLNMEKDVAAVETNDVVSMKTQDVAEPEVVDRDSTTSQDAVASEPSDLVLTAAQDVGWTEGHNVVPTAVQDVSPAESPEVDVILTQDMTDVVAGPQEVGTIPTSDVCLPDAHHVPIVVLFAVRIPAKATAASVAICEPIVLSPGGGKPQSVLDTLVVETHLPVPVRMVLKNLVGVAAHITDTVRAAGVSTTTVSSDQDWHLTLPIRKFAAVFQRLGGPRNWYLGGDHIRFEMPWTPKYLLKIIAPDPVYIIEMIVVLFAVRIPAKATAAAPVAICEPIVLSTGGKSQLVLDTLVMDTHLPVPSRMVLKNLVGVAAHITDTVRAAGVATTSASSDQEWHLDLPIRSLRYAPTVILSFCAAGQDGATDFWTAWWDSNIEKVMSELGLVIGGVFLVIPAPTPTLLPTAAVPLLTRPPMARWTPCGIVPESGPSPSAPALLTQTPTSASHSAQVIHEPGHANENDDVRSCTHARYGFLTIPELHTERLMTLDGIWVAGRQLRAFWLKGAETLLADPVRLMAELHAMAKAVVAVAHLGVPQHVDLDVAQCLVHFWMPRAPGMVHAVMRESGLTTAGLRFEFTPAMAQDAIPLHDHPPARALAVILHAPRRIGDLLDVVRRNRQLSSAVLDCVGLPRIDGYDELRYVYVTVAVEHANYLDHLDKTWVAGKRIRVFRLHDAKSLFVFPVRLMNALRGMAQRILNDDEVEARPVIHPHYAINAASRGSGRPVDRIGSEQDMAAMALRANSYLHPRRNPRWNLHPSSLHPPGVDPAALIPFDARPIGGTVQDLTRLAMWRGRFMQTFTRLKCNAQHVEIDDFQNCVRFWMPRRPGIVHDFSPADARDAIPEHDRPPPRAVFVLFHVPYHTRALLAALRSIQVRTDLLDCFVLPPIPAFPNLSYGFLTVHDAFGDLAAGLDMMWIKGKWMRAFRIQDLTVFADRGRLMEEVQTKGKEHQRWILRATQIVIQFALRVPAATLNPHSAVCAVQVCEPVVFGLTADANGGRSLMSALVDAHSLPPSARPLVGHLLQVIPMMGGLVRAAGAAPVACTDTQWYRGLLPVALDSRPVQQVCGPDAVAMGQSARQDAASVPTPAPTTSVVADSRARTGTESPRERGRLRTAQQSQPECTAAQSQRESTATQCESTAP